MVPELLIPVPDTPRRIVRGCRDNTDFVAGIGKEICPLTGVLADSSGLRKEVDAMKENLQMKERD